MVKIQRGIMEAKEDAAVRELNKIQMTRRIYLLNLAYAAQSSKNIPWIMKLPKRPTRLANNFKEMVDEGRNYGGEEDIMVGRKMKVKQAKGE